MKKIKYYISALLIASAFSSCDDYLTVLPENNQSSYEYWNTKEEVEAVLGAGYVKMRKSIENLFLWGEARGNGFDYDASGSDLQKAGSKLRAFDILPDNKLCDWSTAYTTVSMANAVIQYGPSVVGKDASFHKNMSNSFLAEAYFQRSLMYFYLVRTFKDVPFVTRPYVDDSAPYSLAKSSGESILKTCVDDLETYLPYAKEYFPETENENPINTKGRATKWALHALLADIYLFQGNYDKCIEHCNAVINSGRVGLITNWFLNFYPGNSNESIFEIQFSYTLSQTNSFLTWFTQTNANYYKLSDYTTTLFGANDLRGLNYTYNDGGYVWKYIGKDETTPRSSSTEKDQNYIIYRLADIYLMKAEAYIMKGDYEMGAELIDKIRDRAGLESLQVNSDKVEMMRLLLEERQREFCCEGKNWFDLLRIGLRSTMDEKDEGFKSLFIEQAMKAVNASTQSVGKAVLSNLGSWYLPFYKGEMEKNPLLEQSDYYKSVSN